MTDRQKRKKSYKKEDRQIDKKRQPTKKRRQTDK